MTDFPQLLLLHLMISALIALIGTALLKNRFRENRRTVFIMLFLFNLALPILAYIITLTATPLLANLKEKRYLHHLDHFNKEEFLANTFPIPTRVFGEGAVVNFANDHFNRSNNKMKSLAFIADDPTKQNFSLIKGLLSDKDHEIRLYSFSLLNRMESGINDKITQTLKKFDAASNNDTKKRLAAELASYYWEFIHYGLSDKETERLMLEKIKHFSTMALEHEALRGNMLVLLGKVYFYQRTYQSALEMFHQAIQAGIKKSTLIPFLAEIAYQKREFSEVKRLLSDKNPKEASRLTAPIYAQWSHA